MVHKHLIYFDAKDYELLAVVNRFKKRDSRVSSVADNSYFHPGLHPHGIKELTMSQEIRVAYAVANLLDTLDTGQVQDRINALRALYTEALSASTSSFRFNTGRVLIQIMKSLIRERGDTEAQLRLAHDFRRAATGNRRIVRRLLKRYWLLEMPEAWNQIAFDNHVHDANTKGRKSPTQLIMDAWIKGLRKLDVIYYNYVEPAAVSELLQAADIMGIKVRVGVEFQARFRNRFVQFTWQPRGFADWREMLAFFQEKPTRHLMNMGREASLYHHRYVLRLLEQYNIRLRHELGLEFGISLQEISEHEMLAFVGIGQTSRTHLAELIFLRVTAAFNERRPHLEAEFAQADAERRARIEENMAKFNALASEDINANWLCKQKNPSVSVATDKAEQDKLPEIMRLLPMTLIDWLSSIRPTCHITLNLNNLVVEDVLELLYSCDGLITHLEMFNLKNYTDGRMEDLEAISELQLAINEGSAIALKRLIRNLIKRETDCLEPAPLSERCHLFMEILRNIQKLQSFYTRRPLATRIGSDSTSRSSKIHGMGFAYLETLPPRARKALQEKDSLRETIPFTQDVYHSVTYYLRRHQTLGIPLTRFLRKIPGLRHFGKLRQAAWVVDEKTAQYKKGAKTITTLGGFHRETCAARPGRNCEPKPGKLDVFYMNNTFKNVVKVLVGFALTMATFLYTQHWWVLAWFGAFIWFGITGVRNVLQATLGGGGFRRTPLLGWNDYLSWSRLCDSLLFTGISVPLLELGVRVCLLESFYNIDSLEAPLFFYSIMSMINGLYIAAHNIYRGLPQEAVIGNLFRSVLAVPVSVLYNFIALQLWIAIDLPLDILTECAAVLSKMASDTVAALIEGPADKAEYLRRRHWDYVHKLDQLFACIARLEVILPEEDVVGMLQRPKDFIKNAGHEACELEKTVVVCALDLMYFWFYLPRARSTLVRGLGAMTEDERLIFVNAQLVLTRMHEVSQMLVDGLVGPRFARALAFYLARHEEYLNDMTRITGIAISVPESHP